jgi:hypothetical protein
MKKFIAYLAAIALTFGCQENKKEVSPDNLKDTLQISKPNTLVKDTIKVAGEKTDTLKVDTAKPKKINKDSTLLVLRKEILTAIKNKDYEKFASFIHPVEGVRFSPYGYIMPEGDAKLGNKEFLDKIKQKSLKINWGSYDGTGDLIQLTIQDYFKKFVYNVDYLNAEKISINKKIGTGNSLNNIAEVYKNSDFIESHFMGFDKTLGGMDWQSLRLVFKRYNDEYYLVGIIHDQWTI